MRSSFAAAHRAAHDPCHRPGARRALGIALFLLALAGLIVFVLPQVADLEQALRRARQGSPAWLGLAVALEVASFLAYFALFHAAFRPGDAAIGWRESYLIPMASLAAGRVIPGAGGVALTAWALRRSGMAAAEVARRLVAFLVVLDGVYLTALVVATAGLSLGLLAGPAPAYVTIVPALLAITPIVAALALLLVPQERLDRRPPAGAQGGSRTRRLIERARSVPATVASGERGALALVREESSALLAAVAWWGFDVATLWACFAAFGDPPAIGVIAASYFVGQLASALPLPGGLGGVEGGMIGAFMAFGVAAELALVAVVVYRLFAYWLPSLPGIVAYFQLRQTVIGWEASAAQEPSGAAA